ncbi:MAG: hypothetical protein LBF93_11915 [Zoogloeaceae bacterium]|jgi:hypothetical protein|nr:hypothetical protein [Zoogloeaceae bacterium]
MIIEEPFAKLRIYLISIAAQSSKRETNAHFQHDLGIYPMIMTPVHEYYRWPASDATLAMLSSMS